MSTEKTWAEILADDRAAREAPPGTHLQFFEAGIDKWRNTLYANTNHLYRIRPEPQLRAYTPEKWLSYRDDWFREKGRTSAYPVRGIEYKNSAMLINGTWVTANDAAVLYEHCDPATGETRPCGVME